MACKAVIRKEGKNSAQGYAYVGHEHVLTSGAREALLSQGLVLELTGTDFVGTLEIPKKDGVSLVWRWRGTFQLAHEESGLSQMYAIEATTQANDKAAYVASTALERTMLLRLCQMSGGSKEDPEHDIHDRYEETQHRAATVTEKLDAIAASGGERAERPLAKPTQATARAATTATRGGDPVPVAKVVESVGAQTSDGGDLAEGEIELPWVKRNNTLAIAAHELSGIKLGEMDDLGMYVPSMPCPVFSDNAGKQFAGKRYDDPKVAGFLREKILPDPSMPKRPMAVQLWAMYACARHETRKQLGLEDSNA
jgi:hypothetical protein